MRNESENGCIYERKESAAFVSIAACKRKKFVGYSVAIVIAIMGTTRYTVYSAGERRRAVETIFSRNSHGSGGPVFLYPGL